MLVLVSQVLVLASLVLVLVLVLAGLVLVLVLACPVLVNITGDGKGLAIRSRSVHQLKKLPYYFIISYNVILVFSRALLKDYSPRW